MVIDGSAKDLTATIHGGAASDGVAFDGPAATLKNSGTITGANGAFFALTGTVTNGSTKDTTGRARNEFARSPDRNIRLGLRYGLSGRGHGFQLHVRLTTRRGAMAKKPGHDA
jgi:hypothetical protein